MLLNAMTADRIFAYVEVNNMLIIGKRVTSTERPLINADQE